MSKKFVTFAGIALDTTEKVKFARAIMKETLKIISPVVVHFEKKWGGSVPNIPFPWWDCPAQAENVDKLLHMPTEEMTIPNELPDPHNHNFRWKIEAGEIFCKYVGSNSWAEYRRAVAIYCFPMTPDRAKLFTELFANPFKTITTEIK